MISGLFWLWAFVEPQARFHLIFFKKKEREDENNQSHVNSIYQKRYVEDGFSILGDFKTNLKSTGFLDIQFV